MISRACFPLALCAAAAFAQATEWKMVWHDEFEGDRLDSSKWVYVVGGDGFGNKELEYYTGRPQNLYLESGMLAIRAVQEDYRGADGVERGFTSARIHTLGKFSQAYGKFEARIKLPYGQGIWPAFWMMGEGAARWPDRGEIDIMENIGREPSTVLAIPGRRGSAHRSFCRPGSDSPTIFTYTPWNGNRTRSAGTWMASSINRSARPICPPEPSGYTTIH